jgi:hypothetical protein
MTGYLVPVSKAKKAKKGSGEQATNQHDAHAAHKAGHANFVADPNGRVTRTAPASATTPVATIPKRGSMRPKLLIGGSLLAAGAGGAYLYRRSRVEKSLSSMQREFPSLMMRST